MQKEVIEILIDEKKEKIALKINQNAIEKDDVEINDSYSDTIDLTNIIEEIKENELSI